MTGPGATPGGSGGGGLTKVVGDLSIERTSIACKIPKPRGAKMTCGE
jgi:hypothetical protein